MNEVGERSTLPGDVEEDLAVFEVVVVCVKGRCSPAEDWSSDMDISLSHVTAEDSSVSPVLRSGDKVVVDWSMVDEDLVVFVVVVCPS